MKNKKLSFTLNTLPLHLGHLPVLVTGLSHDGGGAAQGGPRHHHHLVAVGAEQFIN